MELVFPILLGVLLGVFCGVIPGIGNFLCLLIVLPFLSQFDPVQILVCYVALTSISQYVGSIPAIIVGVPGEASSIQAVIESKNLKSTQEIKQSIVGSAVGSTFGSMIVVLMCFLLLDHLLYILYRFDTKTMFAMYSILIVMLVFTIKPNSYFINIAMIVAGILLGMIGYNRILYVDFLSFGNADLYGGLPMAVITVTLLGFPEIFKNFKSKYKFKSFENVKIKFKFKIFRNIVSSVIGFIGGLAPGLTTIFSSQLSYLVAVKTNQNPVDRIIASETANNAGAFSQLLPLMMLGIPLISSEALVINLMESKGYLLESANFINLFYIVAVSLIFINIVGLLIAWPGANLILSILKLNLQWTFILIVIILLLAIAYIGYTKHQLFYYAWTTLVFTVIGFGLKKYNTMPLIFGFLIHDKIIDVTIRFYSLYMT